MKEYLNIGEMAKLRKVTIETLRHYDRIGLLKPDYTDRNRIRYYHVSKAEQIRTIRELQEIGLSLKEIQGYLANRTLQRSYELLLKKQEYVRRQYEFYKSLHTAITEKIEVLDELAGSGLRDEICEKSFPERYCILSEGPVQNDAELFYQTTQLEGVVESLEGYLQIYGSQRYGTLLSAWDDTTTNHPFLFTAFRPGVTRIPTGQYLCVMRSGSFWEIGAEKVRLLDYAKEKGYRLSDTLLSVVQIDYTMSDTEAERLYELQWKIEPSLDEVKTDESK